VPNTIAAITANALYNATRCILVTVRSDGTSEKMRVRAGGKVAPEIVMQTLRPV
jgi:hypothetical protein